jgi:PAP2 superfamily
MFNSQHPDTQLYGQSVLPRSSTLLERLWDDQNNFYSPESVTLLGGGLVVGGLMANTSIDENLHRHFQGSVRGATSDEWFESLHASKELGNGIYTLPVFASAWVAGELFPDNKIVETTGRWGERSIRGFVVGAPPLIVLQQFTGGSRPTEINESSEWHPFRDNNGISGHAFMGSLPFITAAKMTDDRGLKVLFYAGSALTPLSRVNDNAHYPSQVALGWWMAYLAAIAVDATDNPNARWRFYPYSTENGSGMMAEFRD